MNNSQGYNVFTYPHTKLNTMHTITTQSTTYISVLERILLYKLGKEF